MRVIGREYSSTYEMSVHEATYHFDSDGAAEQTPQFKPPRVDVISTGPEGILKYKRIAD